MPQNESQEDPIGESHTYGSKGQSWHPDFVAYMKITVAHPAYAGMPDAVKDDGKIQWEAPSNRNAGRYKNTHHRRRNWWRAKARQIGIDPDSGTWISDTAKRIHPSGEKPCKRCGRVMRIAYVYPNANLRRRLVRDFPSFQVEDFEEITDLVRRLVDTYGQSALKKLPSLLSTTEITVPDLGSEVDKWLEWIEEKYVQQEPALLSPGAMSNAPDRFDGFHSFNLCCRGSADTGRHETNLRLYSTDRRVFEYWSEGDWIAADRLMGLVSARFRNHPCADGGQGPATPDHIGPLSLGFTHRPAFRLLSKAANSAKNNRMTLRDINHLLGCERSGIAVISWHARSIWDRRKGDARDEETALRLSKVLRDNQRCALRMLGLLLEKGHFSFLASLLELKHADSDVEFVNLRIDSEFVTVFDRTIHTPRITKYAQEQKARRLRVAFDALRIYGAKENRHLLIVKDPRIDECFESSLRALEGGPEATRIMDRELKQILFAKEGPSEEKVRKIADHISQVEAAQFDLARNALTEAIGVIAEVLSSMWESDRYVRAAFSFDES